jgi:hypothetical protein
VAVVDRAFDAGATVSTLEARHPMGIAYEAVIWPTDGQGTLGVEAAMIEASVEDADAAVGQGGKR